MTDRFRFWYANLAVIDRSFKHKTRKFAVMYSSLAQEQVSVFSNMTDYGWLWNGCKITSFSREVSMTFGDWLVGHELKSWPEERSLYKVHDLGTTFHAVAKYGIYLGVPNKRFL